MKSYCEDGLRLPILHTDIRQGYVHFTEERPYHLTYILRDFQNNESRYTFTVLGVADSRVKPRVRRPYYLLDDYRLYRQCLWPQYTHRW
jgi:hypothetical protein